MMTFLTIVHVSACLILVLVVLIQSGKGAEISASLGGSSQTVFGSSGGANFFTRFTAGTATLFMVTSIALTLLSAQAKKSVFDKGTETNPPSLPTSQNTPAGQAAPAPATAQPPNTAPAPAAPAPHEAPR